MRVFLEEATKWKNIALLHFWMRVANCKVIVDAWSKARECGVYKGEKNFRERPLCTAAVKSGWSDVRVGLYRVGLCVRQRKSMQLDVQRALLLLGKGDANLVRAAWHMQSGAAVSGPLYR